MAYGAAPDYGGYERQRADVDYRYGNEATQNAYGRFLSQQRGSRQLGDMDRSFRRSFPGFKAGFAQRGMAGPGVNSGVMQQSMSNYMGDYGRDLGRAQQDATQQLQQFDMSQNQLDAWRQQSITGIESQKANDIASAAQNLQLLKQLIGEL